MATLPVGGDMLIYQFRGFLKFDRFPSAFRIVARTAGSSSVRPAGDRICKAHLTQNSPVPTQYVPSDLRPAPVTVTLVRAGDPGSKSTRNPTVLVSRVSNVMPASP